MEICVCERWIPAARLLGIISARMGRYVDSGPFGLSLKDAVRESSSIKVDDPARGGRSVLNLFGKGKHGGGNGGSGFKFERLRAHQLL